jgi:hypothetical protein
MEIELFTESLTVGRNPKNCHVVLPALMEMSFFTGLFVESPKRALAYNTKAFTLMDFEIAELACETVNEEGQVHSLQPFLNVSLFPVSMTEQRNDWENRDWLKRNMKKVLFNNRVLFHCHEVLFIFEEHHSINVPLALEVLKEVAHRNFDEHCRRISYLVQ